MRFVILFFAFVVVPSVIAQPVWTYEPPAGLVYLEPIGTVNSVAFSPDGKLMASGFSNDPNATIRIFDVSTGQNIHSFGSGDFEINTVAFSPDGKILVSGGSIPFDCGYGCKHLLWNNEKTQVAIDQNQVYRTGNLQFWDVDTGNELTCSIDLSTNISSVVFSPDGAIVAVGLDYDVFDRTVGGRVSLVDVNNCLVFHEFFTAPYTGVQTVAFSPDGTMVASGTGSRLAKGDPGVIVWDVNTKDEISSIPVPSNSDLEVNSIVFSPDGAYLIFAGSSGGYDSGIIDMWNVMTWQKVRTFTPETGEVSSIAFSPDGSMLLSGTEESSNGYLHLWDVSTGEEIQSITTEGIGASSVGFSPDGAKIVSGGSHYTNSFFGIHSGRIFLWDVTTLDLNYTIGEGYDQFSFVRFSYDATRLISVQSDRSIRVIDVDSGRQIEEVYEFSGEGRLLTVSPDGTKLLSEVTLYDNDFEVAASIIFMHDIKSGEEIQNFIGHTDEVNYVDFSPDGSLLVSGADDHTMRLWDVNTGSEIQVFPDHDENVHMVKFSPDGQTLVSGTCEISSSGDVGVLRIWDVSTGQEIQRFFPNTCFARLIVSSDGLKIAAADRTMTYVYDVAMPMPIITQESSDLTPIPMTFLNDGTKLVSAEVGWVGQFGDEFYFDIFLWDVNTGDRLHTIDQGSDLSSYAVSRDGNFIATGGEKSIKLWNTAPSTVSNEYEYPSAESFSVIGNYPNPFQSSTSIRLDLPTSARVGVEVFDVTGRRVFMQAPIEINAGSGRDIPLNSMSLPSGAYLYRLEIKSAGGIDTHVGRFVKVQ